MAMVNFKPYEAPGLIEFGGLHYVCLPLCLQKIVFNLNDGGPSSFRDPGLQPILVHM